MIKPSNVGKMFLPVEEEANRITGGRGLSIQGTSPPQSPASLGIRMVRRTARSNRDRLCSRLHARVCRLLWRHDSKSPRQLGEPLPDLLVARLQLRGFLEISKSRIVFLLTFFPVSQEQGFFEQQARR